MAGQDILNRIYAKVAALAGKADRLQKENEQLNRKLEAARADLEKYQAEIKALEQTVTVLRMGPQHLSAPEKKALDKQLNHYLKEIDRCITMLEQ